MNLERTLFWIATVSCVALLVRTLPSWRQQRRGAGWVVVGTAILMLGGTTEVFLPAYAGALAGTLWAVFIVLPSLLIRALLRHALGQRYAQAERMANFVRWLHPADGWRETPKTLPCAGPLPRRASATAPLICSMASWTVQASRPRWPSRRAFISYRMEGRWDEMLAWTEGMSHNGQPTLVNDGKGMKRDQGGGCQTGYPRPRPKRSAYAGACPRRNRTLG